MGTDSAAHATMTDAQPGLFARAAWQLQQFVCGLHGHDELLHFERGRISLLCTSCGHQSPGWEVKGGTAPRDDAANSNPHVVQMPLVRHSRVA